VYPTGDDFPVAAVGAWAGAGTLRVTALHDQTGHGNDVTQSTPANQPALTMSAYGGFPGILFSYATQTFLTASFAWVAGNQPWTGEFVVLGNVASTGWYQPLFLYGATSQYNSITMFTEAAANFVFAVGCYGGPSNLSTMSTTAPVVFTGSYDGSSLSGNVNGTTFSVAFTQQDVTATTLWLGGSPDQSNIWLDGSVGDVILYPAALASAQVTTLQSLARGYYGF
jgi:hypothetical protein